MCSSDLILRKLAEVTQTPLIDILVWADVLKQEEVPATEKRRLTEEEWGLVQDFRGMSEEGRSYARRVWQALTAAPQGLR